MRLRLFSFGGYGLALALVVFGAIECPPTILVKSYVKVCGYRANSYKLAHFPTASLLLQL